MAIRSLISPLILPGVTNVSARESEFRNLILNGNVLSSRLSFSRASAAAFIRSTDGALVEVGNNIPRFDPAFGLLLESQRTNNARNARGEGGTLGVIGSGGVLPTNWSSVVAGGGSAGISREFAGRGQEDGWDYIDWRVFGTASGGPATVYLRFEAFTQIAAATGASFISTVSARTVGGSLTGVSSTDVGVTEFSSGGAYLTEQASTVVCTSTRQRFNHTGTMGHASAAFLAPQFRVNITSGATVDLTLRVFAPQAGLGVTTPTSPILPPVGTPGTTTRLAEALTAPLSGLGISSAGACTFAGTFLLPIIGSSAVAQFFLQIDDGTNNNRVHVRHPTGGALLFLTRSLSSVILDGPSATIAANVPVRFALSVSGAGTASISFDGSAAQTITGVPSSGLTTLRVGDTFGGSRALDGYVQRLSYLPYAVPDAVLRNL